MIDVESVDEHVCEKPSIQLKRRVLSEMEKEQVLKREGVLKAALVVQSHWKMKKVKKELGL